MAPMRLRVDVRVLLEQPLRGEEARTPRGEVLAERADERPRLLGMGRVLAVPVHVERETHVAERRDLPRPLLRIVVEPPPLVHHEHARAASLLGVVPGEEPLERLLADLVLHVLRLDLRRDRRHHGERRRGAREHDSEDPVRHRRPPAVRSGEDRRSDASAATRPAGTDTEPGTASCGKRGAACGQTLALICYSTGRQAGIRAAVRQAPPEGAIVRAGEDSKRVKPATSVKKSYARTVLVATALIAAVLVAVGLLRRTDPGPGQADGRTAESEAPLFAATRPAAATALVPAANAAEAPSAIEDGAVAAEDIAPPDDKTGVEVVSPSDGADGERAGSTGEAPPLETGQRTKQAASYALSRAKSALELQPFRHPSSIPIHGAGGFAGTATLIDVNPRSNAWYVLSLEWNDGSRETLHLENPSPAGQRLRLDPAHPGGIQIEATSGSHACDLWSNAAPGKRILSGAHDPYVPLCGGRVLARQRTQGSRTSREWAADFLRSNVKGGEALTVFVRDTFYKDSFLEKVGVARDGARAAVPPTGNEDPLPARRTPGSAPVALKRGDLGIAFEGDGSMLAGEWYAAAGVPGVFVSTTSPDLVVAGASATGATPDASERDAAVYLVAFDLSGFDVDFELGTDHPGVGWSERTPGPMRDPALPGPDGIGNTSPLRADRARASAREGPRGRDLRRRLQAAPRRLPLRRARPGQRGEPLRIRRAGRGAEQARARSRDALRPGRRDGGDEDLDARGRRAARARPLRPPERRAAPRKRPGDRARRPGRARRPLGRRELGGLEGREAAHACAPAPPSRRPPTRTLPGLRLLLERDAHDHGARLRRPTAALTPCTWT